MKMTKTVLCALTAALALLAGKASATPAMPVQFTTLSLSGSIAFTSTNYDKYTRQGTNYVNTNIVFVAKSMSFNNATIYNIISNAVANSHVLSGNTNVPTEILPADGYIAFSPENDGYTGGEDYGDGFFYVTNKSGFFFQLSGVGTHGTYYSWIELDTDILFDPIGFFDNFESNFGGNVNIKTGAGSFASTSTALLYIHDDALAYDDGDNASEFEDGNSTAMEIRGILKVSLTFKDGNFIATAATLTGTGNFFSPATTDGIDTQGAEVTSATAKLTK